MNRRNIGLFLDGTWNTPEDRTNVYDLFQQAVGPDARHADDPEEVELISAAQIRYYDEGVGTSLGNLIFGGVGGRGLTKNLKQAYRFLCNHYRNGDSIYVFGFSRGAYTARSLTGLIEAVGLIPRARLDDAGITRAMESYKTGAAERSRDDSGANRALEKARQATCDKFRAEYDTVEIAVQFLGVWDTVGALGVPRFDWSVLPSRDYFSMHNTEMSHIVKAGFHALAIDEHRRVFRHTPWTRAHEAQTVEQRWFAGAHADVGGGYKDRRLHEISRTWMQQKAREQGFQFFRTYESDPDLLLEPVSDSYSEFAHGLYALFSRRRNLRRIDLEGTHSVKEVIDSSVWRYLDANPDYRPQNLPLHARP